MDMTPLKPYSCDDVEKEYAFVLNFANGCSRVVQIPAHWTPRGVLETVGELGYFAINTLGEWTNADVPNEIYPMSSIYKFEVLSK